MISICRSIKTNLIKRWFQSKNNDYIWWEFKHFQIKYMLIYSVCALLTAYIEKVRPNQGYLTFLSLCEQLFKLTWNIQ